ncbi:MAG: electron transfer flavoprotein subunit alpha/FixB family protein [Candidatus Marinimicrobia bacterium]|nr:electron transfer flavoprotein subunit alpha/FixB family protein [Candidatus Neomarinimicrobiota bacterium]
MDILIVLEQKNGTMHRASMEAIAAGQSLAKDLGQTVSVLAMGEEISQMAQAAATKDVSEVLTAEHSLLKDYSAEGYTKVLTQVIKAESPNYVIMGHTYMVRDFLPKVSASLGRPLIVDNIAYRIEEDTTVFIRQVFAGKLVADVRPTGDPPYLVTFQSAAFQEDAVAEGSGATVRPVEVNLEPDNITTTSEEPFQETTTTVDLTSAKVIVSIGRGIGKEENLPIVKSLAEAFGGQIASSRPVVDAGWLPPYHQVGSSGQTVAPTLYLALGISGAIQHVIGMKGSKNVVVINKDPEAPLFEIADYGVVGDILEIIPKLTEAVQAA